MIPSKSKGVGLKVRLLSVSVGRVTVGTETDSFYNTKRWKRLRAAILRRDGYMDQMELRAGNHVPAEMVHHIFPKDLYPQYRWASWNLISLSHSSHEKMHARISGELSAAGRRLMLETAERRGIKIGTVTLVAGLPGSGKTTYVRHIMGAGLAYDLDYIAAAFRLRSPHSELHDQSRRMANDMLRAFAANACGYVPDIYVIRAAPDLDEVADINPDAVVICEGQHDITDRADYRRVDISAMQHRLDELSDWAELNDVLLTRVGGIPPTTDAG